MPPKPDPYATATHRRIDALLLILTLAIALVAFWGNITAHVSREPRVTTDAHIQANP